MSPGTDTRRGVGHGRVFLANTHSKPKRWGEAAVTGQRAPQNSPALQGLSHGFITPSPPMLHEGGRGCSQNLPHPSRDLSGHSLPCQDGAVLLFGSAGNKPLPILLFPPPRPHTFHSPWFFFFRDFLPLVLIFWGLFFFFPPDGAAPFALATPTSNSRGYK